MKPAWIGALVSVVALSMYGATLAPDITWAHDGRDGGDLIAAVMTGGVPHPPGYPTYLLLAWPLARLPFGNPAWRLNLFSALAAAGAAGFTALTVVQLTEVLGHQPGVTRIAGACAGLAMAFSPVLWSQATITEVYALTALLAALLMFLAIGHPNKSALYGLVLGLALGASPLLIGAGLMAPLAWGKRIKQWAWAMVGFAIGLGVFLLLPIRALSNAPVNWGNASRLEGWWWLISAQLYRGYVMALPLSSLGARLAAWAGMVVRQFTPVGMLIGLWGAWKLFKTRRNLAFVWLALFASWSVFAIGYNTTDSYVYLIPAFVLLAACMGVGLAEVIRHLNQTGLTWRLPGWVILVLPLAQLLIGWSAADASTDRSAVSFGQAIMAQAPDRALLVTNQDAHTFTLWYFHYVRDERPDVTVVDRDMIGVPWYRAIIERETGLANLQVSDPLLMLTSLGRPTCYVGLKDLECK